ncbi:MAG TPA: GNAT family N-acetyltransferase [Thermotogota bacterium]|nr:GNAT family N-acetyltransferase [Thermotogota bacterium]HPJ88600.1 GNAT family N-acetyltransferase [Thermotogota bacterium]HPR96660.1 GNAT family N-acetyltransferase [Thermotogota bacterium]
MIVEFNSENAVNFFRYSDIYIHSEIKNYVTFLYRDFIYTIGLEMGGDPVGFIAVEKRSEKVHVCQGIFIAEKHRGKGYSVELLTAAVKKSQNEGASRFYSSYFEDREWTEAAKALYRTCGFELSGYIRNTYVSERSEIGKSIEGIKRKYKRYLDLKENTHIKKRSELTSEERESVRVQLGTEVPYNFNPLTERADEEASVILFREGNPAAWLISERRGSDALYIGQLYVKEKYRNRGFFFPVCCTAFDNSPEQIRRYFFYVNGNNNNMLGLLRAFKFNGIKKEKMIEVMKRL